MIIAGAGGHAAEIAEILVKTSDENICFFDSINVAKNSYMGLEVLHNKKEVQDHFEKDNRFVLAIGNGVLRSQMAAEFEGWGGKLQTLIASNASISQYNVNLEEGLNIMQFVLISPKVSIGRGSLINASANIHHDVHIGAFCEISPGAFLLGKVNVGDFTMIGSGALVLPGVQIGSHCIIGAGAAFTKNVADNVKSVGVPGKELKNK